MVGLVVACSRWNRSVGERLMARLNMPSLGLWVYVILGDPLLDRTNDFAIGQPSVLRFFVAQSGGCVAALKKVAFSRLPC
jgi:hypothetical protein